MGLSAMLGNVSNLDRDDEAPPADRVISIPTIQVKMNDLHRRDMNSAEVADLAQSIEANGQTIPARGWYADASRNQVILVYGARRLAACALIGRDLLVDIIPEPSKTELVRMMFTENKSRKDYSVLELGRELIAYLEAGAYKTIADMAEALKEDLTKAKRAVMIAKLPKEILALYTDPSWLAMSHGVEIAQAVVEDEAARLRVMAAAVELAKGPLVENPTPQLLAAIKKPAPVKAKPGSVVVNGKAVGSYVGGGENEPLRVALDRKAPTELKAKILALLAGG